MAKIISASINLSLIDKTKIVKGNKGSYYNVQIVVNDEPDQYGKDCAIRNNLTKDERDAGVKPTYLGNGKTVWSNEGQAKQAPENSESEPTADDLPF